MRITLLPLSIIYGFITGIRNLFFEVGIFKQWEIPVKSICVGNLSAGGTGKTPHVAWLVNEFRTRRRTAILSRGYGRRTKGFRIVETNSNTEDVGDEPQFYKKLFGNDILVAVCENRKKGVEFLLCTDPTIDLIVLDDAYQHRWVKAGFNILITSFYIPFSKDYLLPAGRLRESRKGRKRADLVVVSKCEKADAENKLDWSNQLKVSEDKICFSEISYQLPIPFGKPIESFEHVLLVTGIADPTPLKTELEKSLHLNSIIFPDHYAFRASDIEMIHQKFDTFAVERMAILTTEKDYMRLKDHIDEWGLCNYPWYFIPITIKFHNKDEFLNPILKYVESV